jgi:hypothetical protein
MRLGSLFCKKNVLNTVLRLKTKVAALRFAGLENLRAKQEAWRLNRASYKEGA